MLLMKGQKQGLWDQSWEPLIDTAKSEPIHLVENITWTCAIDICSCGPAALTMFLCFVGVQDSDKMQSSRHIQC